PAAGGFNEEIFDQTNFDLYSQTQPDPFLNALFYSVEIAVFGGFTENEIMTVNTTVNGVALDPQTIQWGVGGQAYLSAVAFNGGHQYDNLVVSAIPEPGSLALVAVGSLALVTRRRLVAR
ncbi:MAG: PEP-CTERM sorting domain-containing protein, partial [Planctomycetota bacterium]